jgi:hypothetical protein
MVEFNDYKGNPIIILKNGSDDKYPFSFGLGKAKKILENIEAIRKWIADNEEAKNHDSKNF